VEEGGGAREWWKWYDIVRWSAVESVQNAAPKVAVFCHLFHRYIDNKG